MQIINPENAKRGDKSNFYSLLFYFTKMDELSRFPRPHEKEENWGMHSRRNLDLNL